MTDPHQEAKRIVEDIIRELRFNGMSEIAYKRIEKSISDILTRTRQEALEEVAVIAEQSCGYEVVLGNYIVVLPSR